MDYLQKFNKFIDKLSESLDTSDIDIKWIDKPDRAVGLYVIGKNTYQLDFNRFGDAWSYKFYHVAKVDGKFIFSPNVTGISSDRFKVMSMSKKGLAYILENRKPNAIVFSALNEDDSKKTKVNGSEITKRQHIYQMMLFDLPENFPDYTYKIQDTKICQIYTIFKNSLVNKKETYGNIENIIQNYLDNLN
jgi:hypothetical protein